MGFPDFVGSGSPEGIVPARIGQNYYDTHHGGSYLKTFNSGDKHGWVAAGANLPGTSGGRTDLTAGLYFDNDLSQPGLLLFLTDGSSQITISDTNATGAGGTGNGLFWVPGGSDGIQALYVVLGSTGQFIWSFNLDGTFQVPNGVDTGMSQTSGSLPTVTVTSGTALQIDATQDRHLCVETSTAGTVQVELSPDNSTFTTLFTKTVAATDGIQVDVPARWYVKLTATTTSLLTATVY